VAVADNYYGKKLYQMRNKDWKFKTGLSLVVISILLFFVLLVIPFLEFERKTKLTISTFTFVSAEVMFYSGGILLGKQLFNKYKSYLNPKNWFRKKLSGNQKLADNDSVSN
jgi:hypothetical protein